MNKKRIIVLAVAIFAIIGLGTFVFAGTSDPEYLVAFDSNSGSYVNVQKVKSGKKATRPEDPTRENYTFDGWYLSLEDETEFDFAKRIFKDTTLIAKWKKVEEKQPEEKNEEEPSENQIVVEQPTDNEPVQNVPVQNQQAQNRPTQNQQTQQPVNPDVTRLNNVLNSMTAKRITTTGENINYSFDGCSVVNTSNTASSGTTVVNGTVTTLYRGVSNGSITSTYIVTCGSQTGNKTVNHVIVASPYSYTSNYESALDVYTLKVTDGSRTASNYTINVNGSSISEGTQIVGSMHDSGRKVPYNMKFNDNANITYAVRSAD